MRQQAHPNVLPLYCSFVHNHNLWMVMPYVSGGSVLNIMKYAYPEARPTPARRLPSRVRSRSALHCLLAPAPSSEARETALLL